MGPDKTFNRDLNVAFINVFQAKGKNGDNDSISKESKKKKKKKLRKDRKSGVEKYNN